MSDEAQAWMDRQRKLGKIGQMHISCATCGKQVRMKGQRRRYDWCQCSDDAPTIGDLLVAHGLDSLGIARMIPLAVAVVLLWVAVLGVEN